MLTAQTEEDVMNRQRIVAGYDGSAEAGAAVRWAVAEAGRTGAALHIVHAYQPSWTVAYYDGVSAQAAADAETLAEEKLDDLVAHLHERHAGVQIVATTVRGVPAPVLLDAAAGARLLVVGNRGSGGLTNLLMGSVSQQVATHARVPVAVVRGDSDTGDGPVVVGVDGSPSTGAALALAFEQAASRGAELVAVRAYSPPPPSVLPLRMVEASEREALQQSLTGWAEKYPAVKVRAVLALGRAAQVLVGASRTARLVVVGSRGHGGFTGLLLGSVGQQLMHHAECPVLVAHRPD
ncbi:universal stress protein [Dactylosporangium sp. AC04546]|uniref:universal stress protein n=1 Tax=Dactylosporangium sp. AC04546 TaxID=2862460 RepID=UPI001EDE7425|nr:universal stress protein [Dactylosporangium sp. AC04546]WVK79238.1 universal stress protein [Dactylosporangium sp. AC04546]